MIYQVITTLRLYSGKIKISSKKCAKTGKYSAIITLGAVIKGSTSHYDYVCAEVSKGVASVSLETSVPVIFGVLTTENLEQAIERAGTKAGSPDTGHESAGIAASSVKSPWCEPLFNDILRRKSNYRYIRRPAHHRSGL